jgi:hypothetical protein
MFGTGYQRMARGAISEGSVSHEHGSDPSSAGNHANLGGEPGRVLHLTLGAFDIYTVTDLELAEVLGDVSGRVSLSTSFEMLRGIMQNGGERARTYFDDKLKKALVVVGRGRRVRAHNGLPTDDCLHGNVLANGKTKGVVRFWESETITKRVRCFRIANSGQERRSEKGDGLRAQTLTGPCLARLPSS